MVVTQKLHAHLLIYLSSGHQSSKVIYDMAGVTENPIWAYTAPGVFFFWTHFFFGTVHLCTAFILMHMLTIVVVISCQGGRLGNEAVRRWQTILRIVQILLHLWAKLRIEHPKQIAALCGLLMEKHFALPVPA